MSQERGKTEHERITALEEQMARTTAQLSSVLEAISDIGQSLADVRAQIGAAPTPFLSLAAPTTVLGFIPAAISLAAAQDPRLQPRLQAGPNTIVGPAPVLGQACGSDHNLYSTGAAATRAITVENRGECPIRIRVFNDGAQQWQSDPIPANGSSAREQALGANWSFRVHCEASENARHRCNFWWRVDRVP